MVINGYELKTELKNADSGFSKWGFATKNGKEYFIKEMINPVYPIDKSIMSDELFQQKRDFCIKYEDKFKNLFKKINCASIGNIVRINDFFRYGGKYYIVTEKVCEKAEPLENIASFTDEKKYLLLKTAAYCFYNLHNAEIVHFDVKPSNIMITKSKNKNYVAKLIDFDSGFIKGDILDNKELGGDLTYLAPETFLAISGENIYPDEKADIFALGLVFHEYWCGTLPYYDEKKYNYPFEAVLDGANLYLYSDTMSETLKSMIESMLNVMPQKRPSAEEIIVELNKLSKQPELLENNSVENNKSENWFATAGDL